MGYDEFAVQVQVTFDFDIFKQTNKYKQHDKTTIYFL